MIKFFENYLQIYERVKYLFKYILKTEVIFEERYYRPVAVASVITFLYF